MAALAVTPAFGAPGDIFSTPAPANSSAAPAVTSTAPGDTSVSTQTGAFQYSIPIKTPPGRNNMVPQLALSYSSQSPIYGGIAAGWTLAIPQITQDPATTWLGLQAKGAALGFRSSMAGGHRLVAVKEPADDDVAATYRAQNDATFARYELINPRGAQYFWRVRTTDGLTYYFGDRDHFSGGVAGAPVCTTQAAENAPLTRVVDPFGNELNYYYEPGVPNECRIALITWGKNANAGIGDFASVKFGYSIPRATDCPDGVWIGAQESMRTGARIVTGASWLDTITVNAYRPGQPAAVEHTRLYTLGYTPAPGGEQTATCTARHAAYRTLYSLSESAWGSKIARVDLPAMKFDYGSAQFGTGSLEYKNGLAALPWAPRGPNINYRNAHNLAWGYRFNGVDSSRWPTVEALMMDVDGDGLVDRVTSAPVTDAGGKLHCGAEWERNRGGMGHFEGPRPIPLPTLKWASSTASHTAPSCFTNCNGYSCVYEGSPQPNSLTSSFGEGCSLNYQRTNYANSSAHEDKPTYLSYRWMDMNGDGLVDLVVAPADRAVYDLQVGTGRCGGPVPQEPAIFGAFPTCPSTPYTADGLHGYTMCGGMYPWIIYRNHGNGKFGVDSADPYSPLPDEIKYQPLPLEPTTGDSSLTASAMSSTQGTFDLDGDGFPDGVNAAYQPGIWGTYRGTRNGGLFPASGTVPYSFYATGQLGATAWSAPDANGYVSPLSAEGLFDMNGDGLLDHWVTQGAPTPTSTAAVQLNYGTSFGSTEITATVRPGADAELSCPTGGCSTICGAEHQNCFKVRAMRMDSSRTLDLDLDGREDVAMFAPGTYSPYAHLNQGRQFTSSTFVLGDTQGLRHMMMATDELVEDAFTWEVRSDMIDLDGDGIPEGVNFGSASLNGGFLSLSKVDTPTAPPRLLVKIDNQRGGVSTISYASISDATVVEQDASQRKSAPMPLWVVEHTTTIDNLPTPAATTTSTKYHYKYPHYSAERDVLPAGSLVTIGEDEGDYAFRGFDEVTTTMQSGAKKVERYAYDVDWSGRLKTALMIPAEAPNTVATIDETSWEPRHMFCSTFGGCPITTYHPLTVDHWTCKNGQDEAACRANTDTFTRTISKAVPFMSSASPSLTMLFKETSAWTQSRRSDSHVEGDHATTSDFVLIADKKNYRLLPTVTTKWVFKNGATAIVGKVARTYDPTQIVPVTEEVWTDNDDAHRAITRTVYDMTTGNVVERWKPVQNEANTTPTSYTYDSRKLFAATETLEATGSPAVRQQKQYTYEYGTGTRVDTKGPNVATCIATNSCGPGWLRQEEHRIVVDGLGRTLERWETYSDDGASYGLLRKVEINTYVDTMPNATTPTSVTRQNALWRDSAWNMTYRQDKTELDGHGRSIRNIVSAFGAAPADQITTYHYANDGTLAAVDVPDPSKNDGTTARYTYASDSLGRPTFVGRPDPVGGPTQASLSISYDGLTQTTRELAGTGEEQAVARTIKDAFGRLVEVDEQKTLAPTTWAVTKYTYGADDRVATITDPEGVTTSMVHDLAGRRISITRGSRTWKYAYDKNGNITAETSPCSSAPLCDGSYTTLIAYDDLDRQSSKLLAPRGLSDADRMLFAADRENFTYDTGPNAASRMSWWSSQGPGRTANIIGTSFAYDAQGHVTTVSQTLDGLAGYPRMTRTASRRYALNGGVSQTTAADAIGSSTATFATYKYDGRGFPQSVGLSGASLTSETIATETRNVAGLVTRRRTEAGGSTPFVDSSWTYDRIGRVTSQVVQAGPSSTQLARQDVTYSPTDDPVLLEQYLGANHKQFHYSFDVRHQLTGAEELTTPGYFSATYDYGPSGRFTNATEAATGAPGGEVQPRNAEYQYNNEDPEQITGLVHADDHVTPYATYQYDEIGNQTLRCLGTITGNSCDGPSVAYLYDGKNQLRRATKRDSAGSVVGIEEYWYDGDGVRIATVKRDGQNQKTEMIWWIGDSEVHYDGNGTPTFAYTYVSLGTPVARVDRTSTGASVELQFHGMAGNTLATVNRATGAINAGFTYAPFGEVIESVDAGGAVGVDAHRRRLNDKYVDELTDLHYYGARYYDALAMAWTQSDPVYRFAPDARWTDPRRGNLYAFSLNNPLRFVDPDGRDVWSRSVQHTSRSTNTLYLQLAWAKEQGGPTTGGGNPSSRDVNITSTSRMESIQVVLAPGESGDPRVDAAIEIGEEVLPPLVEAGEYMLEGLAEDEEYAAQGLEYVGMKMGDAGRTVLDKAGDAGRWVIESIFGGEDEAEGESAAQVIEEITVKLNDIARRVVSSTDSNGLSEAQQAAVDEKPFLLRMQMGTNVHLQIFEQVKEDSFLMSQVRIAPQGTSMPDFIHRTLNVGWEITTEGQWSAHISKYPSDDWGPMIGILYKFK